MFHLILSIALAAGPTETPTPSAQHTHISLSDIASKLNAKLPEDKKIIIPSPGSRQFFVKINDFQNSSSSSKVTKDVLKIADLSIQGCNAYAWDFGGDLHLFEFSKGFKTAREQISKERSLPKALQLVRVGLMATQCKGPIVFNALGAEWLKSSLELLKSLPHKKAKKDDKMRLHALQEQVFALNEEKVLKESLRFEALTSSTLIARSLEEGHGSFLSHVPEATGPTAEKPDFWQQFMAGKPLKLDWERHTQITNELLNAIAESKGPEFKKYREYIDKAQDEGLEGLWKSLNLSSLGVAKSSDLKNEKVMVDIVTKLEKDQPALDQLRKNFDEHPEISADFFKMSLQTLSVQEGFFAKFDTKLNEIKNLAQALTK